MGKWFEFKPIGGTSFPPLEPGKKRTGRSRSEASPKVKSSGSRSKQKVPPQKSSPYWSTGQRVRYVPGKGPQEHRTVVFVVETHDSKGVTFKGWGSKCFFHQFFEPVS